MDFLEKNLEDIIFQTDNEKLSERGLRIHGKKYRQLRIGNYGIADLVTISRDIYPYKEIFIDIFELKKDLIDKNAFFQALNYMKGIREYININNLYRFGYSFELRIVLIGKNIEINSSFIYLPDFYDVEFYTYSYDFDGIKFNRHQNYSLIDNGF